MKLTELLKEGGKLFGAAAERVSTSEMGTVFETLKDRLKQNFQKFQLSKALPSKVDHGDIDIIYVTSGTKDIKKVIKDTLGNNAVKTISNGDVFSVLYRADEIGKTVHVDFIKANAQNFLTKTQYFTYNDFSGIIGMFSKKLHFRYGSEGFFKRYKDRKGQWHDIPITTNLMDGLRILGYNPKGFDTISNIDDIIEYMKTSPIMDSNFIQHPEMNQSDRKSFKRPVINYVITKLRQSGITPRIKDEDYFFKKLFPKKYNEVESKKKDLDAETYIQTKYNGNWLIHTFGLKPGPIIGDILQYLTDTVGADIETEDEEKVIELVNDYLKNNQKAR